MSNKDHLIITLRVGYWSAIVTAILAALFFTVGILTPVRSIPYPYVNVIAVAFLLGLSFLGYDIVSFEVASITIDCTVLIASGVLLSRLFHRELKILASS